MYNNLSNKDREEKKYPCEKSFGVKEFTNGSSTTTPSRLLQEKAGTIWPQFAKKA